MEINSSTLNEIEKGKSIENAQLVEAVLFISGRFLSMQDLMFYSNLDFMSIEEALEFLQKKYLKSSSAIEIVKRNNLWKMDVKNKYHFIANKLATGESEFSKAEQQTLAIIAYKQPIKQSVVIKIRGNKAYDHIHKFIKLKLINTKPSGHTNILTLTEEFYNYFNLSKGEEEIFRKEKNLGAEE
jgi:segregation and condensation protein B